MKTKVIDNYKQLMQLTDNDKKEGYWEQTSILSDTIKPLFASFLYEVQGSINQSLEQFKAAVPAIKTRFENSHIYMKREPIEYDINERHNQFLSIVQPIYPELNTRFQNVLETFFFPFFEKIDYMLEQEVTFDSAQTMLDYVMDMYPKSFTYQSEIMLPHHQLHKDLEKLYAQATDDKDVTIIYDMLIGVWNKSLEIDKALSKLSQQVKEDEDLKLKFQTVKPTELLNHLHEIPSGRKFEKDFQKFLSNYGNKTVRSRVLTDQTWFEKPSIPLTTIASYISSNVNVEQRFQKAIETRVHKYEAVLSSIPEGTTKEQFKTHYQWALDASNLDDDHHFYMDEMPTAKTRLLLLHLSNFLVNQQIINETEDIFYLYLDELQEVLKHPEPLTEMISERKLEYQHNINEQSPSYYGTPPAHNEKNLDIISERATGDASNNEETNTSPSGYIKGLAGSKGIYTGAVKIINNEDEFNKLEDGDILVTHMTTPAWSVLFLRAGAIVTNVGGILSHPGINAREYQIPAVLGTKNATSELKDGDIVTVEGTNGCVKIDERV
ncbi:PEP-utilizing enzyme [Staphylococcus sp. Mo2-6]|uniref:PEP-utilizing enzyme n=1 Tax=Staphylococcus sp. Mo2-6 TaxID=3135641 RepID=UPI003A8214F9